MAESPEHRCLKELAARWAIAEGYRAVGTEVRLPNCAFRADVAGCRVVRPGPREMVIERTAAFECKQSRADFLGDAFGEAGAADRLAELRSRREKLAQLVGGHYPDLRQRDSLFPEYDRVDPALIRHQGYRKLAREIARLERGLFGGTKFDRMIRYRCVDFCYLVVRKGIVDPGEIPAGWGMLECELDAEPRQLEVAEKPAWNEVPDHHRLDLLHRLAVKGASAFREDDGDD